MRFGFAPRLPFGLRAFFRGVFALLAAATLALALSVLQDEKERAHRSYADGLQKSRAQIAARLRHPTGQLMLLNPALADRPPSPPSPLLLPFAAIDFDDRGKAQQAVEMAGCALQYPDGATLCAAVGNNPYAGGFVYVVGSFASGELASHRPGELDLTLAHRVAIELAIDGRTWRWIAPLEGGRLTGFADDGALTPASRPLRDFRGWLWQDARCAADTAADCRRRAFYSVRLPVDVLREQLAARPLVWPPPGLERAIVRVRVLGPGDAAPLFDSAAAGAALPFSLADLKPLLLPGETLVVRRDGSAAELLRLTAAADAETTSPWIAALIRRLPVAGYDAPLVARESIATPLGRYELLLNGDLRSVNRQLAAVATRLSWFVGAMLGAVLLAWLALEVGIIRRVTLLTRRAAALSRGVRSHEAMPALDLSDLHGRDELGVLAQGLRDLLQRVDADLRREQIRAEQERDQWHAVGHEIMSPLQSLLALHAAPGDPSARYVTRMQQAVRVLYGQASPSEAFAATTLQLRSLDLDAFLADVAANAGYIGIERVAYAGPGAAAMVRADEHSLEDVVGHVLRNADRHRTPGSTIAVSLTFDGSTAQVRLANDGAAIDPALIDRIFEYGVSDADAGGQRGQGLFVARTYMAKMGGTITAANVDGGVVFTLALPLA